MNFGGGRNSWFNTPPPGSTLVKHRNSNLLLSKHFEPQAHKMARGNQRDKAREKNLKEQAGKVRHQCPSRDMKKLPQD